MEEKLLSGGKQMARVLKEEGVEYTFGVSGGHIWPFNAGCGVAGIKMVHMRHEQAGGYAADAYARSTGKVGVCFGTAGPGMTNQLSGIVQASSARSPVVAFYGQHLSFEDKRSALQEGYATPIMSQYCKWATRVISPYTMAYVTKKAFRDAMTYPQGPIAIEVPVDIWNIKTPASAQMGFIDNSYPEPTLPHGDPVAVEKAVRLLLEAERPIIVGGGGVFWSHAEKELQELVELLQIPVITRRVARGAVPEDNPLAFKGRARGKILRNADVACTIGLNMGYLEGYGAWAAKARLIFITESREDIEFTAHSDMVIIANPKAVLRQMIDCAKDMVKSFPRKAEWLKAVDEIKAKDQQRMDADAEAARNVKPMHPTWVAHEAMAVLDKDATVILDGFTSSAFVTERIVAGKSGTVLDSANTAGVGHGVGMAIGAQLARPGKQVLVIMGDGGMGLGGFDVETAVRCQCPAVFLLSNNDAWMASIGPYFSRALPVPGTQDSEGHPFFISPTDYAQMFAACGAYTERVEDPAQLKPALERAFKSGKTAVIDAIVRRDTEHPMMTVMNAEAGGFFSFFERDEVPEAIRPRLWPSDYKK